MYAGVTKRLGTHANLKQIMAPQDTVGVCGGKGKKQRYETAENANKGGKKTHTDPFHVLSD